MREGKNMHCSRFVLSSLSPGIVLDARKPFYGAVSVNIGENYLFWWTMPTRHASTVSALLQTQDSCFCGILRIMLLIHFFVLHYLCSAVSLAKTPWSMFLLKRRTTTTENSLATFEFDRRRKELLSVLETASLLCSGD
jgi:hypothetical protein